MTRIASRAAETAGPPPLLSSQPGFEDTHLTNLPTQAGRGWEIMLRFYGPQKPLFDKTWALPDVARVAP